MISLYCNILRPEEKSIAEEIKSLGSDINIRLTRDGLKKEDWNTAVLLRTVSHYESQLFATYFECSGVRTINSAQAIRLCTNKAALAMLAESNNIPQPKFRVVFSPSEFPNLPEVLGHPFVIKPISSSWGRGICQVRDKYCLETWLAGRESLDANHRQFPVLAQEYIEKPGYDIRVVVVEKEPIVAFQRISEHWKTNTHTGASVRPTPITKNIEKIVSQITDMMGVGIYGIDLLETLSGQLLLNEVNHNPEFAQSSQVHGINVAYAIARFAQKAFCKTGETSCAV